MNLKQAYFEAMRLLGYVNVDGCVDLDTSLPKLLTLGNAVLIELTPKHKPIKRLISIDEKIPLDERIVCDCFIYGLAMWIALQNNDSDNEVIFSSLYEQKKHNLTKVTLVEDIWGDNV